MYFIVYSIALGCLVFITIYTKRKMDKPSKTEILLEQQNDLFSHVNNTLVGFDTRLREIQESNGFSNDK